MSARADRRPARLFTTFHTAIYLDHTSAELRHGDPGSSPANVLLVPEGPSSGRLIADHRASIHASASGCRVIAGSERSFEAEGGTILEILPLERGLFGLRSGGAFLCAEPDGRVTLTRSACSTWESFLASEPWCGATPDPVKPPRLDEPFINRHAIKSLLIDPRLRCATGVSSSGRKVLVFGYPKWSHGRVYYDLARYLHGQGYIIDILNWQEDNSQHLEELTKYYDFVLAAPDGICPLADTYGVPYAKIIAVSHHEYDLRMLIDRKGQGVFDRFAAYGVVSEAVYAASLMLGIRRPPQVASLGVDCAEFHAEPPERLDTVGYASSMAVTTYDVEWKRGYLAEEAARRAGLPFVTAGSTARQISFHDMPDFYRRIDALLMSSLSEAGPLPIMEAAAAGRLVIGTPVGHFPQKVNQGGGILAPIEPEKYVSFVTDKLVHYKDHPKEFRKKCAEIQNASKGFDWRYVVSEWRQLIDDCD